MDFLLFEVSAQRGDAHTAQELESDLGAVGWELYNMAAMAARVGAQDPVAHTAYLEAHLIHVRCLLEFFVGREGRDGRRRWNKKDLKPTDYLPEWQPPPQDVDAFASALDLIDSTLSHISLTRTKGNYGSWGPESLSVAIIQMARKFAGDLEDVGHPEARTLLPWVIFAHQALWGAPEKPPPTGYVTTQDELLRKGPRRATKGYPVRTTQPSLPDSP